VTHPTSDYTAQYLQIRRLNFHDLKVVEARVEEEKKGRKKRKKLEKKTKPKTLNYLTSYGTARS